MVYDCFLDDSKDANQSKLFVSAGFFGSRDDWSSLRNAWRAVLREKEIEYFKSSEYNHLTHQFGRVAHLFDFAGMTDTVGAPSFAQFCSAP